MAIAEVFSTVRKLQNITQSDVADYIKVTQSAVAKFETGKATLSLEKLQEMADILHMNPEFVADQNKNPFDETDELIAMQLPESLAAGIDFWILHFLAEKNKSMDVLFLIAPLASYLKILPKTYLHDPVYAIAARDGADNLFLFRRKSGAALFGSNELQLRLSQIAAEHGSDVAVRVISIDAGLTDRIRKWKGVSRGDIQRLFEGIEKPLSLTAGEKDLIKGVRELGMDPEEVLRVLRGRKAT